MSHTTTKKWKLLRVFLVVFLLGITALVGFIGLEFWLMRGGIFKTSDFDAVKWKSLNLKTSTFSCYRGGMANDIKSKVLRVGQSKSEVENILGKPDIVEESRYEYLLGLCSGLRIDFDTLDAYFDSDGKLKGSEIVQH